MTASWFPWLGLVLALSRTAAAQTMPSEAALAPAFERRLTDELATRGIVLARDHVGLLIEPRGGRWSVSLFDLATRRPVAVTEIDGLPDDPDQAVTVLIRAVVALENAIDPRRGADRRQLPPVPPGASPEQVQRHTAEAVFRQHALRFAASYDLGAQDRDSSGGWQVFRGGIDEQLPAPEFYRALGREDLARAYERRHVLMLGGFAVAGVAFVVGVAGVYLQRENFDVCHHLPPEQFDQCVRDHYRSLTPAIVAAGVGVAGGLFGTYFFRKPHPIDENDAKALADAYNQRLRGTLGLPVATRAPVLHDLALSPSAIGTSRGLALAGRF